MTKIEKFDRVPFGVILGFIFPLLTVLIFYLFSADRGSLANYFDKIIKADIMTHIISLCVLPNLIIFLVFNRLDMLRATRGVLGITIFWAAVVFAVKFFV